MEWGVLGLDGGWRGWDWWRRLMKEIDDCYADFLVRVGFDERSWFFCIVSLVKFCLIYENCLLFYDFILVE